MTSNGHDAAQMNHHRSRARAERLAATRAEDERARRAHLELAVQHEIAMFQSRSAGRHLNEESRHVIGATLRAVMALPDASTGRTIRLDVPLE